MNAVQRRLLAAFLALSAGVAAWAVVALVARDVLG